MSFNPAWEPDSKLDKASSRRAGPSSRKPKSLKATPKGSNDGTSALKTKPSKATSSKLTPKLDTNSFEPFVVRESPLLVLAPRDPKVPPSPPPTSTYLLVDSKKAVRFKKADEAVYTTLEITAQSHTNPKSTNSKLAILDHNAITAMVAAVQARIILAPQCEFDLKELFFPEISEIDSVGQTKGLASPKALSASLKASKLPIRESGAADNNVSPKRLTGRAAGKPSGLSIASKASSSKAIEAASNQIPAKKISASGGQRPSNSQGGKAPLKSDSGEPWSSKSGLVEKPDWPPGQNQKFNDIRASKTSVKGLVGGARYSPSEEKAASTILSSLTAHDRSSRASLTSAGRNVDHARRPSDPECADMQYMYTGPDRLPGGGIRRYGDAGFELKSEWEDWIDDRIKSAQANSFGVLMLLEKQGCTFGYGNRFKVEDGTEININSAADARHPDVKRYKTRHLLSYGDNIEQIGTTGCFTCLGVYFAIAGNRVFCAHLNVWTNWDRSPEGVEPLELGKSKKLDMLFMEVRLVTKQKMKKHMAQYGWKAADVKLETVKFVSVSRSWVAWVVALGILDAIGGDARNFTADHVDRAVGFIITPGSAEYNNPRGKLLKWLQEDRYLGNIVKIRFAPIPVMFKEVLFRDDDGIPRGDWIYTAGIGRWAQWTKSTCNEEFKRGRWRPIEDA